MKIGKVSNAILDRSVHRILGNDCTGAFADTAAIGHSCSVQALENQQNLYMSTAIGDMAVFEVGNHLSAYGARLQQVQCSLLIPEKQREQRIKERMKQLQEDCAIYGARVTGGQTEVSRAVNTPVVTVTGSSAKLLVSGDFQDKVGAAAMRPDEDIIVTKWIGIGGIQQLIQQKRAQMEQKYSARFVNAAFGERSFMSTVEEAEIAIKAGVRGMYAVSWGGILAALWNMAEAANIGLEVDFRAIPVKQEIIELCEMFGKNPYELNSIGCLLMTSARGCDIVDILEGNGIPATIIGRTTSGNDRILRNLDEVRYLDVPQQDSLYWEE